MKPLYFSATDLTDVGPLFYSASHYYAVRSFLSAVEQLHTVVLEDLCEIVSLYTFDIDQVVNDYRYAHNEHGLNDHWKVFCKVTDARCVALKNELLEWAKKYHLDKSRNDLYLQIALAEVRRLFHVRKRPIGPNYPKELLEPFERASLTRVIVLDGVDTMRVSDGENGLNALPFTHPFVFAPSESKVDVAPFENPHQEIRWMWDDPSRYEGILEHMHSLQSPFSGESDRPSSGMWKGIAWDGRNDTWSTFKTSMTKAFERYLQLYKRRTEQYLKEHEYEKPKWGNGKTIEYGLSDDECFEWLVMFQVMKMNKGEISDIRNISPQRIKKALDNIEPLVLLELRPSDPAGRPSE